MGNILSETTAVTYDASSNATMNNNLTVNGLSTFNGTGATGAYFNNNVILASGKTINGLSLSSTGINGVNLTALNTTMQGYSNGIGLGTFNTGNFSGALSATGGFTASTGQFTNLLTTNGITNTGNFTGTTGQFNSVLTAGGITNNANFTGTSGNFSGLVTSSGGVVFNTTTPGTTGTAGTGGLLIQGGSYASTTPVVTTFTIPSVTIPVVGSVNVIGPNTIYNFDKGTLQKFVVSGNIPSLPTIVTIAFYFMNNSIMPTYTIQVPANTTTFSANITASPLPVTIGNYPSDAIVCGTANSTTSPLTITNIVITTTTVVTNISNKWTIAESAGPKTGQNRLCLSLNNVPYACLAPTGANNMNLMPASDPNW